MSKANMGAKVMFCGHDGWFIADIHRIEGANVVIGNPPVNGGTIVRGSNHEATHHISDYPCPGYWSEKKGIFVVPEKQVKQIKK